MTQPDYENMPKDEFLSWFDAAGEHDLAALVRSSEPAGDTHTPPSGPIPLLLTSIRLPVDLVHALDQVAAREGTNRSDVIRAAVSAYIVDKCRPIQRSEAEEALAVIARVVGEHTRRSAA